MSRSFVILLVIFGLIVQPVIAAMPAPAGDPLVHSAIPATLSSTLPSALPTMMSSNTDSISLPMAEMTNDDAPEMRCHHGDGKVTDGGRAACCDDCSAGCMSGSCGSPCGSGVMLMLHKISIRLDVQPGISVGFSSVKYAVRIPPLIYHPPRHS
jgi:hypothetical protein